MVDLFSYNGKFLGFTEKQVQQGIRLFEEDCAAKMDKLTEDNVARQTKELNSIDQFRADVKQFKECGNKEMNDRVNAAKVLENVAFKTLELNGSGEFVSNGDMLKMQNDYNSVVETVRKQHSLIDQLNSRINKNDLEIADQRENLDASRKLRKKHEKEIKLLNAKLDVANAENELARKRAQQSFINQLVNAREQDLKEAEDRLAKLSG